MNASLNPLVRAVLYEGYVLYPYRPALKNTKRWTIGGLWPAEYVRDNPHAGACEFVAETLVQGGESASVSVTARFLHVRRGRQGADHWDQADEREVFIEQATLGQLAAGACRRVFAVEGLRESAGPQGLVHEQRGVAGLLEAGAERLNEGLWKVRVHFRNDTGSANGLDSESAEMTALHAAHAMLEVAGGECVSLAEPPPELLDHARRCRNVGVWPVLIGEPGDRSTMLAAPIILEDYPRIAPESPGDFFDNTEIDEMLALRVLTLTEQERERGAAVDGRVRDLLARVRSLNPDSMTGLHGALRAVAPHVPTVTARGLELRVGDTVRLAPRGTKDMMDIALRGQPARIESIEQDMEGRVHVAVSVQADPGRDLGAAGVVGVGHRFFFSPAELEPLDGASP